MKEVDLKCHALILGISNQTGIDYHEIYEKSVNIEKFATYLKNLRQNHGKQKIALYLDNLSVHRSNKIKELMKDLDIKYVWGIPYSPDYQPIESVFSMVKNNYRKESIYHIINNIPINFRKLIRSSFENIERIKVQNCINRSRKDLIQFVE